jgi:hypothetical protein
LDYGNIICSSQGKVKEMLKVDNKLEMWYFMLENAWMERFCPEISSRECAFGASAQSLRQMVAPELAP